MDQNRERDHGLEQELVRKITEFERSPARERREGLSITEQEASRVKELVSRELENDRPRKDPYSRY